MQINLSFHFILALKHAYSQVIHACLHCIIRFGGVCSVFNLILTLSFVFPGTRLLHKTRWECDFLVVCNFIWFVLIHTFLAFCDRKYLLVNDQADCQGIRFTLFSRNEQNNDFQRPTFHVLHMLLSTLYSISHPNYDKYMLECICFYTESFSNFKSFVEFDAIRWIYERTRLS